MPVDPLEIASSTADAAFGTDEKGRVVIWNKAAERLLGYGAAEVLGKLCHEVLCGTDIFGNRLCDQDCTLNRMVRYHEAVHRFEMEVRNASGQCLPVEVFVIVVRGPKPSQYTIIHLLRPTAHRDEAESAWRLADSSRGSLLPVVGPPRPPPTPPQSLTTREAEILRLLAAGSGTDAIADSLFISVTTVRNHIQNILRKLEVHSKLEAVSFALRNRLI
jgi:PAS domain S-box-containing protein